MARLLEEGHYTRHLRKAGGVYQRRSETLCALLREIPGAWLRGEEAGLHFLFGIKGHREEDLIGAAGRAGIPLQGLAQYCGKARQEPALVLGFAGLSDDQPAAAVQALRAPWQV